MPDPLVPPPGTALAAIERYLAAHPEAADSAQGIAQWWLPACGVEAPLRQVEQALQQLQQRGTVLATRLPGGQVIWRAAR